ncbi:hypothetical protein SDJN02_04376, partial [Cucurbita argyrosperma subsp. argyrosperma]
MSGHRWDGSSPEIAGIVPRSRDEQGCTLRRRTGGIEIEDVKSTIAENSEILGGGDGGARFVEGDELDGVAVEGVLKTGIVR